MGDHTVCMKSVRPISTGIGLVYAKPKSANSPGVFCTNEKERKSANIYTYTTHNTQNHPISISISISISTPIRFMEDRKH
jgi:hypothetical protein